MLKKLKCKLASYKFKQEICLNCPQFQVKQQLKKLEKYGYCITRQKGSHVRLNHFNRQEFKPITIPLHKSIKP
ncbi:MAG: type II toxin-antitoxin system HicA family toxin [bacterium]